MKKIIIATLIVIIIFLISLIYKSNHMSIFSNFPDFNKIKNNGKFPTLNLYVFFSKNNCIDCLQSLKILNELPKEFKVVGFIPTSEIEEISFIRKNLNIDFEVESMEKIPKKFYPNYGPSIIGVGYNGKVYFVLPGVPNEKDYLKKFLTDFYSKAFPLLIPDNEN